MFSDNVWLMALLSASVLFNLALVLAWPARGRRRQKQSPRAHPSQSPPVLDEKALVKLRDEATERLDDQVKATVKNFEDDLSRTAKGLNDKLSHLAAEVIEQEMKAYREQLTSARTQADQSLSRIQSEIDKMREEQQSALKAELAAEKKQLVSKLDRKLGDVVSSYIAEALGQEVDLGAQSAWLISALEANKDRLKEDILSERR